MRVVMLSGPIGAGKTTVARELLSLTTAPSCYLEGDTFWSLFAMPDATARRERFRLIMRSMTAAAVPLARRLRSVARLLLPPTSLARRAKF